MYGKKRITRNCYPSHFEALRAYSIEEVRIGLTRHIQSPDTGQFFPKPADVNQAYRWQLGFKSHDCLEQS